MNWRRRFVQALFAGSACTTPYQGLLMNGGSWNRVRVPRRTALRVSADDGQLVDRSVHSCWRVPAQGLSGHVWEQRPKPRLTSSENATLPIALMVIAPDLFPTRSKAMRAIRQKQVFVLRDNVETLGRADTRIYPLDSLQTKRRASSSGYRRLNYERPAMSLPVIYEDDHMAIVNKPAGMICHSQTKGGYDKNSVLRALPHFLTPPQEGTDGILKFPSLVHRLDTVTSGLLVIAKTRLAAVDISEQFATRKVRKTYTALLQGSLFEDRGCIDHPIDGKPAMTKWFVIRKVPSTKSPLTLVTFHPKHGRKHQLRRHASEVLKCPIVGDTMYGSTVGTTLLLCATDIVLNHPLDKEKAIGAKIDLPRRFTDYMTREESRYAKYEQWMMHVGMRTLLEMCEILNSQ